MRISRLARWLSAAATVSALAWPVLLAAQATGQLTGTVTSSTGAPLSSVSVNVVGTASGTLSGPGGRYTITGVPAGTHTMRAVLIGYGSQTQEVTVLAGQVVQADFQLQIQALELEGIVAVGYGVQRRETLTGAVATVSGETLQRAPVTNLSNALSGNVPGVITVNSSGEPGNDGATIRIRGSQTLNNNNALIVIDGVPDRAGGLDRLNPQDIESISVLKDASAAIYGSRAANGVILVTTKRGREGAPQLTANVNQGFNQPTRTPRMTDAATYMTMLNEIDMYRGRSARYSAQEIENHRIGADPWLYPNTDWFAETIKPVSMQTRGDLAVRGGADRVQYYVSLGGLTEDGYFRNSATRFNQYGFRSNIDAQPTNNLNLRFDVNSRLEERNFPNRSAGAIFRMVMRGKPNLPAYWPNGLPGPDIEYGDNPVVVGTPATGYNRDDRNFLQGNLGLDYKVPGIQGLTIRSNAAYDRLFRAQKQWRTPWTLYTWDGVTRDASGEPVLQAGQRGFSGPELQEFRADSTGILLNLLADFRRDFGSHSIGILGGAERQKFDYAFINAFRRNYITDQIDQLFAGGDAEQNNSGSAGVGARQNYFTRVNYSYADKYLFEFIGRYDGSYIFPEDRRFGFFPAFSTGWRISEEPFFRDNVSLFNDLKIRGSWGRTGNDRIDEWQYLASYGFGAGYVFGVDSDVNSIFQTRTPNPYVTWEVANQLDIGVEARLLDDRLSLELDHFRNRRSEILHWRNASVPHTTGLRLPRENIGEVSSWGWDGSIAWRQAVANDISYDITFNGGFAQNRIDFWDEPEGAPEWQRSTGSRMNTGLYYEAIGIFKDEADLERYPHWPGARPGDIIFRDVNGDGRITADDRVRINRNAEPNFIGGLTLGSQVRSFDFTVFFQGSAGAVQYVFTESGEIGNFTQDFADKRWTPENPNSSHPRTYNRSDEYWASNGNTYFLRNADYLRLKTLEIGYRLPNRYVSRAGLSNMRVYAGGFNLLTWDSLKVMDPEARSSSGQFYPQKRVLNVGTSVTF
jgi:TonB-dependent starch-binding outer membrane protein SusC